MVELLAPSFSHDKDAISVNNRRESVCDQDDGTLLETCSKLLLNDIVGLQVDVGRRLVKHQDPGILQDCPGHTDKLLLSHREQVVALGNNSCKTIIHLLDVVEEVDLLKDVVYLLICVLLEWIDVVSDRTLEEKWLLWNIGDTLAK